GEPPAGRHLQVALVTQGLQQPALARLACGQDRPALAALAHALAVVEPKTTLELLRLLGLAGVALVAMLDQDRANLLFEELNALGGGLGGLRPEREKSWEQDSGQVIWRQERVHRTFSGCTAPWKETAGYAHCTAGGGQGKEKNSPPAAGACSPSWYWASR